MEREKSYDAKVALVAKSRAFDNFELNLKLVQRLSFNPTMLY